MLALVEGLLADSPTVQAIDRAVGTVHAGSYPLIEGATVVTGTMDAWGSVYGSGLTEHGDAMEVAGTSEILALFSRERHAAPGIVSFLRVDGLYLHAGPTQAGGAALAWFAGLAGLSTAELLAHAAGSPPGAGGLIFMPHLLGERAPLWDSDMRGAFIGLSSDHTIGHLCRAVLEGVAYSARHLLESLELAGGVVAVRATGERRRLAERAVVPDQGRRARPPDRPSRQPAQRVSRRGVDGGVRAGLVESVRAAARDHVRVERRFEPEPRARHLRRALRALPVAAGRAAAGLRGARRAPPATVRSHTT